MPIIPYCDHRGGRDGDDRRHTMPSSRNLRQLIRSWSGSRHTDACIEYLFRHLSIFLGNMQTVISRPNLPAFLPEYRLLSRISLPRSLMYQGTHQGSCQRHQFYNILFGAESDRRRSWYGTAPLRGWERGGPNAQAERVLVPHLAASCDGTVYGLEDRSVRRVDGHKVALVGGRP